MPAGELREPVSGATVSVLRDDTVLVYGNGPSGHTGKQAEREEALRRRHDRGNEGGGLDPRPKLWDPTGHGWRSLPDPPECPGRRFLHTATTLHDGRVLIGGGVCDRLWIANEPIHRTPQLALSLWDPAKRRWQPAPALHQERLWHSATVLPDGSVVFVGGATDPALQEPGEPLVTARVERFQSDAVTEMPPLREPRAGHGAVALPDGSLLVAGGFGADGRVLSSVELWRPGTGAWMPLPPLAEARHDFGLTVLSDGRLLVAGGRGATGRPLASTELWDRGLWLSGPPLPYGVERPEATLLADGSVLLADGQWRRSPQPLHQLFRWKPAEAAWSPAGRVRPSNEILWHPGGLTLVPRAGGGALLFTPWAVLRWQQAEAGVPSRAPVWAETPALAALPGDQVLAIGEIDDEQGRHWRGHLWDRATDQWSVAGRPSWRSGVLHARALRLPNGRVLHAGIEVPTLFCETWAPGEDAWRNCDTPIETRGDAPVALALLPGGAAAAMVSREEVLVFDPATEHWSAVPVRWSTAGLTYGAPIAAAAKPLAEVQLPSGTWIDVSDLGARYWQGTEGRRTYDILIEGRAPRRVESRAAPPEMLWDPAARRWAYIYVPAGPTRPIGPDATFLADGCALSTRPLALFDPRDGLTHPLDDPGIGIPRGRAAMAVLPDGFVVIAGPSALAADAGAGWFTRHAGCTGFAPQAGDADYLQPRQARDRSTPIPASVASTPASSASRSVTWTSSWRVALEALQAHQGLLLVVLGPVLGYGVMRRFVARRQVTLGRRASLFRWLVYGTLLAALAPALVQSVAFFKARQLHACRDDPRACLDAGTERLALTPAWRVATGSDEPPQWPCRLIGVWSSRQRSAMRRIELKDDGRYAMAPSAGGMDPTAGYAGHWAVQGGYLVWRHAQRTNELDFNRIVDDNGSAFTLVEMNGQRTRFERLRQEPSTRCTP